MAIIETQRITKHFTIRHKTSRWRSHRRTITAVDRLDLTIEAGTVVGVLGPNGAGKSTTIKMLTGILTPSSGHISVDGLDPVRQRTELTHQMGVVFGHRSQLWWDLPLIDSFHTLRRMYATTKTTHDKSLAALTDILDLGPILNTPVRQLSLGQRMRGELTAALLHQPKLLYLDEPTIGLDIISKNAIRSLLTDINHRGATVILTTHDMTDVEQLCDRVVVIDNGRTIHDGTVTDTKHAYGDHRLIIVDLHETHPPLNIDGTTTLRTDGPRQWLQLPIGASVPNLINQIANQASIRDLSIQDPTIEDIIHRLYTATPS